MKSQLIVLLSVLAAGAFSSDLAHADSVRCGSRFVSSGDSTLQARKVCGEPDLAEQRTEYRTIKRKVRAPCAHDRRILCEIVEEHTVPVTIDEWIYDFGAQRLVHHLRFEQSRLVSVRTEGYGEDDQ